MRFCRPCASCRSCPWSRLLLPSPRAQGTHGRNRASPRAGASIFSRHMDARMFLCRCVGIYLLVDSLPQFELRSRPPGVLDPRPSYLRVKLRRQQKDVGCALGSRQSVLQCGPLVLEIREMDQNSTIVRLRWGGCCRRHPLDEKPMLPTGPASSRGTYQRTPP